MKGTAPNMSIEENLALAYLRASAVKGKFFQPDFPERKANVP